MGSLPPPNEEARKLVNLRPYQARARRANGIEAAGPGEAAMLDFVCLDCIEPRPVKWVWEQRIALGKLTLIAGDPSIGKSQIANDIVARITTGEAWPDKGRASQGRCLMLSAEDAVADTLRPRLEAAGADLQRVEVLTAVHGTDGKRRSFSLQDDLAALEAKVVARGDVVLVSIDPITSYMGNIDSHRTTDVRAVLEPLTDFAERLAVAVLAVSHPPKATPSKALHAVTGSLAFVAAARFVLVAIEEPETERRLLLPVKSNLSAPADGIGYRLVQRLVTNDVLASYVAWDSEPVTVTANEAMRASGSGSSNKITEAEEFLREELATGPVAANDLKDAAKRLGIKERTLKRAKQKLGVRAEMTGFQGQWMWSLLE